MGHDGRTDGNKRQLLLVDGKREAVLYRKANSAVTIGMKSNILSEAITMAFKTDLNGPATNIANGIRNNRFEALFVNDADGYPAGLKITALGDYDKTPPVPTPIQSYCFPDESDWKYKYTCIIKGRTTGNWMATSAPI